MKLFLDSPQSLGGEKVKSKFLPGSPIIFPLKKKEMRIREFNSDKSGSKRPMLEIIVEVMDVVSKNLAPGAG